MYAILPVGLIKVDGSRQKQRPAVATIAQFTIPTQHMSDPCSMKNIHTAPYEYLLSQEIIRQLAA